MTNYGKAFLALFYTLQVSTAFLAIPRQVALIRPTTELHAEAPPAADAGPLANVWTTGALTETLQGNTLRTWDFENPATQRVQLAAKGYGRPIEANIEYWHTPSYIPMKFKVYSEDGKLRPINAVIETPKHPKTIACYNIAMQEFPFEACVGETGRAAAYDTLSKTATPELVQGGKVTSYTLEPSVNKVQILLKTKERNMKARIELLQGPNNIKQSYELYASVGYKTPFYAVIDTPGVGNVIRIVNQNTLEFPFDVWVVPYEESAGMVPLIQNNGL